MTENIHKSDEGWRKLQATVKAKRVRRAKMNGRVMPKGMHSNSFVHRAQDTVAEFPHEGDGFTFNANADAMHPGYSIGSRIANAEAIRKAFA